MADEITRADLQAVGDVAARLAEIADGLPTEQAILLLQEAEKAAVALRNAIDLLKSRVITTLEQPILIGKTAWSKKPVFKLRPDQVLVQRTVATLAALPDDDGELPSVRDATDKAVKLMADLYVSPSTVPKVGGVTALGLKMGQVCAEEHTSFELKRTELE